MLPFAVRKRKDKDAVRCLNTNGNTATAVVGGTSVARAIRRVTLAEKQGVWYLTSYGRAVQRCHLTKRR